jgi:hypothetical protein
MLDGAANPSKKNGKPGKFPVKERNFARHRQLALLRGLAVGWARSGRGIR